VENIPVDQIKPAVSESSQKSEKNIEEKLPQIQESEKVGPLRMLFLYIGLLYCSIIWGSTFIVVKNTVEVVDPLVLIAYRFTFAGIFLGASYYIFNCFREKKLVALRTVFRGIDQGIFLGFLNWASLTAFTYGIKTIPASSSAFIYGLGTAFIPFFMFLIFKIKPTFGKVFAALIAIIGLWVLTGGMNNFGAGELLTLVSCAIGAIKVIYTERFVKSSHDMYIFIFQQFLTTGIFALIVGLISGASFTVGIGENIFVLIYLILLPTFTAFIIEIIAEKYIPAFVVALIVGLQPIFAAIFAHFFGGEALTLPIILGGVIIFSALPASFIGMKKNLKKNEK